MSDITERIESSVEGVNKEPVETTTVITVETTAEAIAETVMETVNENTVATAIETAVETIVEITTDKTTTSAKTDSVHTGEVKKTEQPTTTAKLIGPSITKGKYAMVSVDVDTTGRRLIDEVIIFNKILSTAICNT